jgi:hypothetical protein
MKDLALEEKAITYTGWEADTVNGCYCDFGFTGPSCSIAMCPTGDNPRTTGQQRRVIKLTAAFGAVAVGSRSLSLAFQGATTTSALAFYSAGPVRINA